jgi:rubrerythrin
MSGGMHGWKGLRAEGVPEAGISYFSEADSPGDLIRLAWMLEDGTRRFYSEVSRMLDDSEAVKLFHNLTIAEEHHKASLVKAYHDLPENGNAEDNASAFFDAGTESDIMGGGIHVSEALKWVKSKSLRDTLELAISLEANAYDLYIKMERRMEDSSSKKVFSRLSDEEKKHLEQMTALLEKDYSE